MLVNISRHVLTYLYLTMVVARCLKETLSERNIGQRSSIAGCFYNDRMMILVNIDYNVV